MADPVRRVLGLVPVLAAVLVLATVPMPMFALAPGPARDVLPLIEIEERRVFPSRGRLVLTTVTHDRATALEALRGWIDAYVDVVPERQVLPPGISQAEEDRIQRSQMDESKLTAVSVALRRVTDYPATHGEGALVRRVEPGGAAEGSLFGGDLIVRVDGDPVAGPGEVTRAVRRAGGRTLRLEVRVGDGLRTVRLAPAASLGVEMIPNFPFPILIESAEIGGPSAGLMWALGVIDLLTPGDLTGGRLVAGTGTIGTDGTVGPVGGIAHKIVAADRAGADVFFVPRADLVAARSVPATLELVPVDDLEDALDHLVAACGCPGP